MFKLNNTMNWFKEVENYSLFLIKKENKDIQTDNCIKTVAINN